MCVCGIDGGKSVCSLIKAGSTASNSQSVRPDIVDWTDVDALSVVLGDSAVSGSADVGSEVSSDDVGSTDVDSVDVGSLDVV